MLYFLALVYLINLCYMFTLHILNNKTVPFRLLWQVVLVSEGTTGDSRVGNIKSQYQMRMSVLKSKVWIRFGRIGKRNRSGFLILRANRTRKEKERSLVERMAREERASRVGSRCNLLELQISRKICKFWPTYSFKLHSNFDILFLRYSFII